MRTATKTTPNAPAADGRRLRSLSGGGRSPTVQTVIPDDDHTYLLELAAKLELSPSEIVRQAVLEKLNRYRRRG